MKYLGFVIILFIAVVLVIIARRGQKKENLAIKQYADSHGYTFDQKPDKDTVFDTGIFTRPHSLTIRELMTSSSGRSFVTVYAAGNENTSNNNTEYTACITNTSLQSTYFNLIPKALLGMFIFKNADLSSYQLEAQLSELYELYIKAGNEVEALSMLTPDILLYLATNFQSTSVIARPNKLYVFLRKTYSYKAELGTEFSVDVILNELNTISDKLLKINTQQTSTAAVPAQPNNPPNNNTVVFG